MSKKHGHSRKGKWSRTYNSWVHMIQRCTNPNNKDYHFYGGRGINVCKRWMGSFENFLEDMGEALPELQLDRSNNDRGYCKSNCRWATRKQQQRNKHNNRLETYNGKIQCIAAWVEETGISRQVILWRLNNGWSTEKALTTSVQKRMKRAIYK